MRKVHSIKYNFIMNCILKVSAFIFPLITFPYVSRVLGAAGNGQVSFASSLVSYFSMIATLGIPTYGVRICAQCRDDKEKLSKTVQELLFISIFMTLLAYSVLLIATFNVPKLLERRIIICISSISIGLTAVGMEWFYQAIEEYGYITYRNLLFKIISVVLMFLCVRDKEDYILFAGVNVVGTVGSNILNLIRIRKYIYLKRFSHYNIRRHLKPIIVFFLFSVATMIYTSLDTVMLGFMSNDIQVGYYNAATKMKNILVSLVTSLGVVLLPRASYYIENNFENDFIRVIKKAFQFVIASAIPISIFFMIEAKDTILFLAGKEYRNAIPSMIIIIPTVFFIGLSNIIGMQIFIPIGLEKLTVFSTFVGALIDLLLNSILIPIYGAAGAAIGTVIAEFGVLVVQIFQAIYMKKIRYIKIDWKDTIKVLTLSIIASVVLKVFHSTFKIDSYFFSLLCSCGIYFGIYIIGCVVLRENFVNEYMIKYMKVKRK